ncbi:hypothetical protein [Pseudomonas sp. 22 E 5]|uniref:Uncharacterized protein n=1 Tax=Pseudomonas canadensis TaxID=915099 RepID=A0A423FEI3_9PSED|nr:hypothetical protein [Pseudomonas canadensis]CRM88961.1 hypothetical protein [Pseudomonas sp. 22 E 5]MCF5171340.1 hypothetical protein [Pseudomonas canadensis]MEB2647249.1 hypothetical protein [Pseudomonas canadensis]ROM55979.1 hypothetical protein BK649_03200 [Pseudomonas canadensis]WLH28267.1 hypothetical protein PSH56_19710 [Pseudomonas canadensis]
MREYTLNYLFNDEPRTHVFELKQPQLQVHEAALHLLQLHFGDAENGLILPPADASPDEILEQAQVVGITQIAVA